MTTNPLVPAPELPYTLTDIDGEVLRVIKVVDSNRGTFLVHADAEVLLANTDQAVELAAAILTASGSTARVIDVGELPTLEQWPNEHGPQGITTRDQNGVTRNWDAAYVDEPDEVLTDIHHDLAVLEARATKPKHDPAEVEAVVAVISTPDQGETWGERARNVLDALNKVREEKN